ncbi:EMP1-trafficking protein [Plasmodium sp. gorilla clade G2]|uniref:EMP1-trafficking protein n=1 Tax=Plasmodium sp. gorilla clade G2 TaxID=880535 RepID=UPI000D212A00|nr:EMP1-trafficking protein [Plasmodium sp. gorilla clade G2]SOV14546.1 EMP1-trafficking protein [Plasmodium sp. gorilla clade G2]
MENIINKKHKKGGNSKIFVLLKFSIYTILLWIVTFTTNNYKYNDYNNEGRNKQVRHERSLSEAAVEFDTIFDVFKESFLDQMGCSDQDKNEIKNAMKMYYDNIDINALSNEIQNNENFLNEFGNDASSINKIMKTDITSGQGTSADDNKTENNVSTSYGDDKPESSTSGVERKKERPNLFTDTLSKDKNNTNDIKKEENKKEPSQLDENNHSATSSYQGEKNNEKTQMNNQDKTEKETDKNETVTKKPSKYTLNLDSPLLKGSSEGETSSKKAQDKSIEPTKKPSKYTLNLDSPLLKGSSEDESQSKKESNDSNGSTKKPSKYTLNLDSPLLKGSSEDESQSKKESKDSNGSTKKPSKYTLNLDSPLLKGSIEGESSSNKESNDSNGATKKPSKYTLNLDSPLLKGSSEGETSSNKESNDSNGANKKPSKYTLNVDSPLLKGSSEGETSSNKESNDSNGATKKPSKYTLNVDSPLLKSEKKSDVKRGASNLFSLDNIGKLDLGSILVQNLELLKGFALNFQTLSLIFLVFVGQFYPEHFQKAAIFVGMVNVFLECKRLYGRSQKKLK